MKKTLYLGIAELALMFYCVAMMALAQQPAAQDRPPGQTLAAPISLPAVADIQVEPSWTVVILRDNAPDADMVIVRTFFWQQLQGFEKPILRSVVDVIPAIKNSAVGATGAADPKTVYKVHLDLVKLTDRLEWTPPPPVTPPAAKP